MTSRRQFRFTSVKLDRNMTRLLCETEAIMIHAEFVYRKFKPEIRKLNRKIKLEPGKKVIDDKGIEARISAVKDKISALRKQIKDFSKQK